MDLSRFLIGAALGSLAAAPLALAAPSDAERAGRVADGARRLASEQCQECHGEVGNSLSASTPKLSQQREEYIVKQLRDFRTDARKHPVMSVMAASLEEEDRIDIATYFSSHLRAREDFPLVNEMGRALFQGGDVDREIPQCINCHGEAAQGGNSRGLSFPMLARQHRTYLRIQLIRWRLGDRSNSPDGVMNRIARILTDDDIDALAEYLSGL